MSSSPAVAPTSELPVKDPAPTTTTAPKKEEGELAKMDRRRLKKLRKRACRFSPMGDLSGISKREEWNEVKQWREKLQDDDTKEENYVPWVGMRQTKKQLNDRDKSRDGFDHRYTLKRLVHSSCAITNNSCVANTSSAAPGGDSKKRKRPQPEGNSITIPSWVCLHNVGCVDHVAVMEVHLAAGKTLKLEDVYSKMDACLGIANSCSTSWFDGPRPQSVSDVLLYDKPIHSSKKKTTQLDLATDGGKKEFLQVLKTFVLSPEELQSEGYPFPECEGKSPPSGSKIVSNEFRKPGSFSLEEAKAIVEPSHASVAERKFPFVQTLSETIDDGETLFRVLGVDCEMVKTERGLELARITVIEYTPSEAFSYRVLMDELVVPYPPVLDYVTEYSGITESLLANVTTRLEQVQASLLTYLRPTDILVGHSLENDLIALRWIHPTVIDTAVLFRANGHFKYSLKHLSNVLLKKQIQGKVNGHCSEEDAAATLELAIRRAQEGPTFAIQSNEKQFWMPPVTEKSAQVFIGPSSWLTTHVTNRPCGIHALTCDDLEHPNTKAIFSWLTGPKRRAGLVWANFELTTPNQLNALEKILMDLKAKMSSHTVLMVNFQEGYGAAADESQLRSIRRNAKSTLSWTEGEERNCRSLVENSRKGKVFWVTKHPGPV